VRVMQSITAMYAQRDFNRFMDAMQQTLLPYSLFLPSKSISL
jgi:hypothetical protein